MRSFLVFIALMLAGLAFAHSTQEATTLENGARRTEAPDHIHMVFDSPITITFVRLANAAGDEFPIARGTPMEVGTEFHANLESLAPGHYTVEWRGVAEDGHLMQGAFSFEVAE